VRPPLRLPTSTSRRPVSVAVTGGIGAGKSEALKAFARHGAAVISSDEIVHRLLAADDDARDAIATRWGGRALGADGRPDRAAIARIVFADRDELDWLERLLHPKVVREYLAWREQLAAGPDPPAVAVTEVPLLYETGGDARFDRVVAVTAPPEVRAARSEVAADERERRLLPDAEKVRRADFAYVNEGTIEQLDAFVRDVLRRLSEDGER
jgi:dephospho-CoA kinase